MTGRIGCFLMGLSFGGLSHRMLRNGRHELERMPPRGDLAQHARHRDLVGGEPVTVRQCAARGCRKWSRPNGFFCSDACRARTWKQNHPEYRHPPSPKQRQNAAERSSRVSNGGLQVSAMRMFRELQRDPPYLTERCAREVVARCLSDRQRDLFLRRVGQAPAVLSGQLDLEGRQVA